LWLTNPDRDWARNIGRETTQQSRVVTD
jgi:hypothetical protein